MRLAAEARCPSCKELLVGQTAPLVQIGEDDPHLGAQLACCGTVVTLDALHDLFGAESE